MAEKIQIEEGQIIGIYKVMYLCDYKSNDGHKMYHCKCCECGWETDRQARHIKTTKQCAHKLLGDVFIDVNTKWQNNRIGHIYSGMKQRCYNTTDKSYRFYGAKGIKIDEEWLTNPIEFENWSLTNGYNDDLTIDRIDSSKNYGPNNCRWVPLKENSKFKSTTNYLEIDGIIHVKKIFTRASNRIY